MAAAAASVVAMAALIAVVPTAAIPVLAGRQGVLAARLSNAATAHGVAARPIASASGGTCLGLRESHCVPCPEPEQNDCDRVKRECDNLLCSPLCLDLAWNCTLTVDAGSPLAAAMTASEKAALCAQVVAEACSTEFGCCAKDGALYDWVERFAYQGQYPASLLPVAPCLHDPRDKAASDTACNKCKAALGVKLAVTKERCAFGAAALARKGGKDPAAPAGGSGGGGGGTSGDGPSGGAHKSFEERCEALALAVETKLPSLW